MATLQHFQQMQLSPLGVTALCPGGARTSHVEGTWLRRGLNGREHPTRQLSKEQKHRWRELQCKGPEAGPAWLPGYSRRQGSSRGAKRRRHMSVVKRWADQVL